MKRKLLVLCSLFALTSLTSCGPKAENKYPIIKKIHTKTYGVVGETTINTWADDLSSVTCGTDGGISSMKKFLGFDKQGHTIEEGTIEDNVYTKDLGYTYSGDQQTSKIYFRDGEAYAREDYIYDQSGRLTEIKFLDIDGQVETLWKHETREYGSGYEIDTTKEYEDGSEKSYCEDKWTITTEGENTKHFLQRRHDAVGEFTDLGYLIYNKKGFVVEKKEINKNSPNDYTEVTYREDGNISTMIKHQENDFGVKRVFTYNENGFMVKTEFFDYNTSTTSYDILEGGYDYETDDKGTITKIGAYTINNNQKVFYRELEYEIEYVSINFSVEYQDIVAETKGTYNQYELIFLPILG